MPFLSQVDSRQISQELEPAAMGKEASFGEVFAAGVGQVFDEELSVSSMLNLQGINQRKVQVREHGNSGAFNIGEYTNPLGDVDYNRISADFPELKIKNDKTLYEERATLLKSRREYAQDVFDRGNGMAQFLGMATGYMLDPVNIATMPIATVGTSAKGLTAVGKAIQVAKNEAGLAVATELMIQPLVYQHKHDINSPFEFSDALVNIATAATGAGLIGASTGGISGYLKAVREKTVDLPLDDEAVMSLQALARVEDDLNIIKSSKGVELEARARIMDEYEIDLTAQPESIVKAKAMKVSDLSKRLPELEAKAVEINAKADRAIAAGDDALAARLLDELEVARADIEKTDASLKNLSSGKVEVDSDVEILATMNTKMNSNNQPAKVKEDYIKPERKAATTGSITARERDVIERNGLTKDYDADIEAFKAIENPRIIQDDEIVSAEGFMKSIDDEISGIDDVLRCVIG